MLCVNMESKKQENSNYFETKKIRDVALKPTAESETLIENAKSEHPLSPDRLLEEVGDFGMYQLLVGATTGAALVITALAAFNFVFVAVVPEHRCWIPQCEENTSNFYAKWTKHAVPYKNERPDSCHRYEYITSNDGSSDRPIDTCSENNFNQSQVIQCDIFMIKNNEDRLLPRLNMLCSNQEQKLTLIATASTIGRLFGMPIAGVISDKVGRLNTIVWCSVIGTIFGCLQALPTSLMSFELYLILELCVALSTAGVLGACYVYNLEWVTAKYRVILNTISSVANSLHVIIIGFVAWYFEDNFVAYKLILAVPGIFLILSYFVMRESPQWLLAQHKYTQAIDSIKMAGKINGEPPQDKTIEQIQSEALYNELINDTTETLKNGNEKSTRGDCEKASNDDHRERVTLNHILTSKVLGLRLVILSSVWLAAVYAYYGIILGSSNVHSNKYISYVLIGLAEIPGALMTTVTLDRFGRRMTIGVTLLVYGSMLLLSAQMTAEQQIYRMIFHCVGRAAIKAALLGISTYTTELWPTAVRNTVFSICGLCGRLGGIFASLAVLLGRYYVTLPTILSGSVTIVGAVLLFVFLPETLNSGKLPDTIDEAIAIGRNGDKISGNERKCRPKA